MDSLKPYLFYQYVRMPSSEGDFMLEDGTMANKKEWESYNTEIFRRNVSKVAVGLLALAAMTIGGLYLGEVISTETMIPLAAALGGAMYLCSSRYNGLPIPMLCAAMASVALALLVSEQLLPPMTLLPLLLPITHIPGLILPADPNKDKEDPTPAENLLLMKREAVAIVITLISAAALASLLLFTNTLSIEAATSIWLGCSLLTTLLSHRASPNVTYTVSNILLIATMAALLFSHILPEQFLIGSCILGTSVCLPITAMVAQWLSNQKAPPPEVEGAA